MSKRLMVIAATLAVAIGAWADTETVGGYTWTYRISGDTAEIYDHLDSAAISPMPTGAVTIPFTLGGKPVTSIGDYAFLNCNGLTSVTIPDSVTRIGHAAFSGCSGLTSVTIPYGVKSIGTSVFLFCSGLTSVTIPDSVTSIGERAFEDCSDSLYNTTAIPNVMSVDGWVIGATDPSGDLNLTGIRGIGDSAFAWCTGLTSVTIPDSVKSIGEKAFEECRGLTSVTIPQAGVNSFKSVFSGYNYLSLIISDGVTVIGKKAFDGCSGLMSVTIPNSVTRIEDYAFSGCSGLTSVTIPEAGVGSFKYVFSGYSDLALIISDGVTSIGDNAFSGCSGLTSVTIPDSVKSIGGDAFKGCSGLTSMMIPDGVTSIGSYAFSGCSGLARVTIPDSVTRIGTRAFEGCSDLLYDTTTIPSVTLVDGWLVGITDPSGDLNLTGIRGIGDSVFSWCADLTSVRIPQVGVNSFKHVFSGYSDLALIISDGVTIIGEKAFDGCSGLASVTIPDSVTSIGYYAFYNCRGLTNIFFSGNAPTVGYSAFSYVGYGCTAYVKRSSTGWGVEIPGTWNGVKIRYQDASAYVVSFDANGGTLTETTRRVDDGTAIGSLPTPMRESYTFAGWFTAAEGGVAVTAETVVTADVTYYAHWTKVVEPEPVTPEPVTPDPVTPDPVIPDPVTPEPVTPNPVTPDPVMPAPVTPDPVTPDPVTPEPVTPDPVTPDPVTPDPVTPDPVKPDNPVTPDPVTPDPVTPDPVTPDPVKPEPMKPEPVMPDIEPTPAPVPVQVVKYGGVVENVAFTKAQVAKGALYDAKGNLVGTVELKFGKKGKKGVKISASATMIIGGKSKKISAKAVTLGDGETRKAITFKDPIGEMMFAMGTDGVFTLKGSGYEMVGAIESGATGRRALPVGGVLPDRTMHFNVTMDSVPSFGKDGALLDEALPVNEPVHVAGGKWSFDKVSTPKYKKNLETGAYELLGLDDQKKPNLSSLKLSYTAKTGQFKGTFKLYATNEATTPAGKSPKLKAYTVNVIGFVVDGVGCGSATLKKPAATWSVTVE